MNSKGTCDDLGVDFDVNLRSCARMYVGNLIWMSVNWVEALLILTLDLDVISVVESWLHGDEEVLFAGYKWFGNNRK